MKAIQYFTPEYLEECKKMSTEEILEFLDTFRRLQEPEEKSVLISIRIPKNLLEAFKAKSKASGTAYQTQIKKLMRDWL